MFLQRLWEELTQLPVNQRAALLLNLKDASGFGCITRLQKATGGARFNNLFTDAKHETLPEIDFAAHARSMGAVSEKVSSLADLETALKKARERKQTSLIAIDTDPWISTEAGGHWWDVAVPEVSMREQVKTARKDYETALAAQRVGD